MYIMIPITIMSPRIIVLCLCPYRICMLIVLSFREAVNMIVKLRDIMHPKWIGPYIIVAS